MIELSCEQVELAATEYAFGTLPADEAKAVSNHILGCRECRANVEEMREIGDQLLGLVPDVEPPLGFDQRVLAAVGARRVPHPVRRRVMVVAAAAAVIVAAGITAITLEAHQHHNQPTELTAALRDGNRSVGSVYVGGHPPWVTMTVSHLSATGSVTCQLVSSGGSVTTVGTFQLVDGSGSWGAPDSAGMSHLAEIKLVSDSGEVVALAAFSGR